MAEIHNQIEEEREQIDKLILASILSALGLTSFERRLDAIDFRSDVDILSQVLGPESSDRESLVVSPGLNAADISIWTRFSEINSGCKTPACYVVLGECRASRFACVVSSRLGRSLEKHNDWFSALRTFCLQLEQQTCLLMAPGQYTFRFLRRLTEWIPLERAIWLQCGADEFFKTLEEAKRYREESAEPKPTCVIQVWASSRDKMMDDLAVADHCHEVRALHVRPRGNVQRLLAARLEQGGPPQRRTLILVSGSSSRTKSVAELLGRGAIAWHVFASAVPEVAAGKSTQSNPAAGQKILRLKDIKPDNFVSHFTRKQNNGWLDEGELAYLDKLLLGGKDSDRGAFATLWRIILQRQLTGGNRLTRDTTRVVSFTNRLLSEYSKLRTFRSHLARWDFEPYGIAILRDRLAALGGRPVIYGTEQDWLTLGPTERPFFQLSDGRTQDWSLEEEWRILGDFDLNQVSPEQAIVFVSREAEALQLASVSPWPILVLDD